MRRWHLWARVEPLLVRWCVVWAYKEAGCWAVGSRGMTGDVRSLRRAGTMTRCAAVQSKRRWSREVEGEGVSGVGC